MSNEHLHPDYTAADALTDALVAAGVTHIFLNSGTDYPPIIESWAKYEAKGLKKPEIIISPHEYAALSAAQGFAQLSGQAQAVFVHVDVGTQNLGGAIHNAYRCRTPVFILAGLSPYTMEGELKGGRNAQIQFLQDTGDQAGIVRGYTKLAQEMRCGQNVQQMVYRALQLAHSQPQGPVYSAITREVLEEEGCAVCTELGTWAPIAPAGLDDESIDVILSALEGAERPLIVTSYLGKNTESVPELVSLSHRLAVPVVEMNYSNMNFPADDDMHLGYDSHSLIGKADVVLVIDSDMPWVTALAKPADDCRVLYLDVDPLKETIPLWYIPSERFMRADSCTALRQLNARLEAQPPSADRQAAIEARRAKVAALHKEMRAGWEAALDTKPALTPEYVAKCLRDVVDADTIILNETITSSPAVERYLPRTKPGTYFFSGGSSLGWHGGAAVGMKLAAPEKDVVALTGDGTYIFSCPTAVFWMARRYSTPFMTVIFNNRGWNAPKMITRGEHPDGYAAQHSAYWTSLEPAARLDLVAEAAGGAFAVTVSEPDELPAALARGRQAVRSGQSAVINVLLPPV